MFSCQYNRVSKVLVFGISTFCHYSFDLLWLVRTNWHATTWLVGLLPSLCTDRHRSQVLSLIKWGRLLLCFVTAEHKYRFVLLREVYCFFMVFMFFCIFITDIAQFLYWYCTVSLLALHSFFEPNKHFTLKMYFDIYHGFISLNHKHWESTVY
jgi:hypothetical protein